MNKAGKKIAVFGSAHPHVLQVAEMAGDAGFEVVGLYDDDPSRRIANAELLGVPGFAEVDALLAKQPSMGLIGAVPCDRADLAVRCARAGIDSLVDKPLALTAGELAILKQAVAETGRRILVYYPYRGHPHLQAAKAAIAEGRIGRLVCIETTGPHGLGVHERPAWHWERSTNGDILLDIGAHGFDICNWFAQADAVDIDGRMGNFAVPAHPDFRDFGVSSIRFSNGVLGRVAVDWLVPPAGGPLARSRFAFQGTTGRIDVTTGSESAATVLTGEGAAPLNPLPGSMTEWTVHLLHALCSAKPCDIKQDEVWRASEASIRASAAARAEEAKFLHSIRRE